MPASLSIAAGTMRARIPVRRGTHLSDSLLIPPPTMIRSGASSASTCWRYSSTCPAHLPQLRSWRSLACSEARDSASRPRISMCPNSVLGTSTPPANSALPIPVPNVSSSTVPRSPTPAPNVSSATPAASAAFRTPAGFPMTLPNSAAASIPIQDLSRLAAVLVTPLVTTPGKVMPTGPDQLKEVVSSFTTPATASGRAGCGVSIFCRSASSFPVATSTGAPLMPEPPMSMPSACMALEYAPRPVPCPRRGGVTSPVGHLFGARARGCSRGRMRQMNNAFKVAAIGVGILIAFLVGGWIIGFVIHAVLDLVIAAAVVGAIVVAVKMSRSRKQVSRKREEKQVREPDYSEYSRPLPRADIEPITPQPGRQGTQDVDDELARLKREMGR